MTAPRRFMVEWRVMAIGAAIIVAACGSSKTPTTPSTTSSMVTENWSGVVAPAGTTSHSFTVSAAGTITVTSTATVTTLGIGVGLPRVAGGGCRLGVTGNTSLATSAQITTQADVGQYCVQVYDVGSVTADPVPFALKIEHP